MGSWVVTSVNHTEPGDQERRGGDGIVVYIRRGYALIRRRTPPTYFTDWPRAPDAFKSVGVSRVGPRACGGGVGCGNGTREVWIVNSDRVLWVQWISEFDDISACRLQRNAWR